MDISGSFAIYPLLFLFIITTLSVTVALTIALWRLTHFIIKFISSDLLLGLFFGLFFFLPLAISITLLQQLPIYQVCTTTEENEEEPEDTDCISQTRPSTPILASLHGNDVSESENHNSGDIDIEHAKDNGLEEGASDAISRANIEIEAPQTVVSSVVDDKPINSTIDQENEEEEEPLLRSYECDQSFTSFDFNKNTDSQHPAARIQTSEPRNTPKPSRVTLRSHSVSLPRLHIVSLPRSHSLSSSRPHSHIASLSLSHLSAFSSLHSRSGSPLHSRSHSVSSSISNNSNYSFICESELITPITSPIPTPPLIELSPRTPTNTHINTSTDTDTPTLHIDFNQSNTNTNTNTNTITNTHNNTPINNNTSSDYSNTLTNTNTPTNIFTNTTPTNTTPTPTTHIDFNYSNTYINTSTNTDTDEDSNIIFYNNGFPLDVVYQNNKPPTHFPNYFTPSNILHQIFAIGVNHLMENFDAFITMNVKIGYNIYTLKQCVKVETAPFSIIFEVNDGEEDRLLKISTNGTDLDNLLAFANSTYTINVYDASILEQNNFFYYFYVTEKGITLSEYLQKKRTLPPSTSKKLIKDLILAVHSLHQRNVIHHNINPNNIVIIGQSLKLQGFDFTKSFSQAKNSISHSIDSFKVFGFLPPEFCGLQQKKKVDFVKLDIFAVCSVIHFSLFGVSPYAQIKVNSFRELRKFHSWSKFQFPSLFHHLQSFFPASITDTIVHGLNWIPSKRSNTLEDIAALLLRNNINTNN